MVNTFGLKKVFFVDSGGVKWGVFGVLHRYPRLLYYSRDINLALPPRIDRFQVTSSFSKMEN